MILLKKLARENHSAILVVTHDLRMVEGLTTFSMSMMVGSRKKAKLQH